VVRKFGPFDTSQFYEVENRRLQRAFNPRTGFVKAGQGAVTAGTGAQLVIAAYPDGALIDGLYVENPATETVTLTTNSGNTNPRIDRLVMRLDMTAKTIAPYQIVGTPAASPSIPPLVNTGTVVDMPLCHYTMPGSASAQNPTSIIDDRYRIPSGVLTYGIGGWTNVTRAATNNYDLGSVTVDPRIGPYTAVLHAQGSFTGSSTVSASLRVATNIGGVLSMCAIPPGTTTAIAARTVNVPSGEDIIVTANLEVLNGTVTSYSDARHSFLEVAVYPL
jgi:hypothetical protein